MRNLTKNETMNINGGHWPSVERNATVESTRKEVEDFKKGLDTAKEYGKIFLKGFIWGLSGGVGVEENPLPNGTL